MISVCITTYNGQSFVRDQLDSILCQLGDNDEVVLSDDNSADSTLDVVYGLNDSRIRVIHHDPSTVKTNFILDRPTHNFENALVHSKGDIIFLSDQDDVWLPDKVKLMCKALENADMAIHNCKVVDSGLKIIESSYFDWVGIHQGVWPNFIRATYLGCCMAFHRRVLEKAIPFPVTKIGHDLWLGIVADKFYKTVLVQEPLILYRKHENSKTTSGRKSENSLWYKISYRITILGHILRLK